jgi:hypothetical protein
MGVRSMQVTLHLHSYVNSRLPRLYVRHRTDRLILTMVISRPETRESGDFES